MGKLKGKVAVITGGSSGMALETAKLFVEEGAYVFITGRRQEALDKAVKAIGSNVTGVRADSANLADLDRLYEKVKSEKGHIDIVFASAGAGEVDKPIGLISEKLVDDTLNLNVRGTLFTVQKALSFVRRDRARLPSCSYLVLRKDTSAIADQRLHLFAHLHGAST